MQVATIDFSVPLAGNINARFTDPAAIECAELVVWRPQAIFERYEASIEQRDDARDVLGARASQDLLAEARGMRTAFRRLLERGGTLVCFVPVARVLGVHTLQEIVDFEPMEVLPVAGPRLRAIGGDACRSGSGVADPRRDAASARCGAEDERSNAPDIRCDAGEPFRGFFTRCAGWLQPRAALAGVFGHAVASAPDGSALASFGYEHPGRVLLLPAPRASLDEAQRCALLEQLRELAQRLDRGASAATLPSWALASTPPEEAALRAEASRLAAELARTQQALNATRRELREHERIRLLNAGDAASVVAALPEALYRLGAYPQPHGDDELDVAFEIDGRAGVLIPVAQWPDEAARIVERAQQRAHAIGAELGLPVTPLLLFIAENRLPPDQRSGTPIELRDAAASAGVALVATDALLQAWLRRDGAFLMKALTQVR